MSEECTHDCSTCSSNCGSKDPKSLLVAPHPNSKIGKVIGVVSGKGGVGKSMVTDLLAVEFARRGYRYDASGCRYYRSFDSEGIWYHRKSSGK